MPISIKTYCVVMKKLVFLFFLMLSILHSEAQQQWGIVSDMGDFYPLSEVEFLIASDSDASFAMGYKNGGLSAEIQSVSFEFRDTPTGIKPVEKVDNNIYLYPNPALTKLFVISGGEGDINIFDLKGNVVKTVKIADGSNGIYVGDLDPGIYLLKTSDYTVKFLKK